MPEPERDDPWARVRAARSSEGRPTLLLAQGAVPAAGHADRSISPLGRRGRPRRPRSVGRDEQPGEELRNEDRSDPQIDRLEGRTCPGRQVRVHAGSISTTRKTRVSTPSGAQAAGSDAPRSQRRPFWIPIGLIGSSAPVPLGTARAVVARIRELATQDRRIVSSGHVQAVIHDDDHLRAAIRDLIDETRQPAPPGTRR